MIDICPDYNKVLDAVPYVKLIDKIEVMKKLEGR